MVEIILTGFFFSIALTLLGGAIYALYSYFKSGCDQSKDDR